VDNQSVENPAATLPVSTFIVPDISGFNSKSRAVKQT